MNRSAFCSYFKRCKGMTFSQFVTEYRLNTACELLKHSQKQVSEICFAVGFNDVPHFNRIFKKLKGVTPQEYRKKGTSGQAIFQAYAILVENDVVSENAITLTFCLKIRDYDDRAFLRIEEIGSALWSNYPFYPVFLYEYLYQETKVMGLGNAKASVRQRYRMCQAIHTVGIGYATYRNGRCIRMKSTFLLHKYEIG